MSGVIPLKQKLEKIERRYSGVRDLKSSVVGVVLIGLRLKICLALHENTSDIKVSITRGVYERSVTTDNRN